MAHPAGKLGSVDDLVERYTRLAPVPLVPELRLHRTSDVYELWETTAEPAPPFWAIPWAGGQALARYVLDHPHIVRCRRVLDVGAGSGLVAIAAARADAASVVAVDIDPRAVAVIARNATANRATVHTVLGDPLDGSGGDAEVVLVGDAFYERALAARMLAFLHRIAHRGASVSLAISAASICQPISSFLSRATTSPSTLISKTPR